MKYVAIAVTAAVLSSSAVYADQKKPDSWNPTGPYSTPAPSGYEVPGYTWYDSSTGKQIKDVNSVEELLKGANRGTPFLNAFNASSGGE